MIARFAAVLILGLTLPCSARAQNETSGASSPSSVDTPGVQASRVASEQTDEAFDQVVIVRMNKKANRNDPTLFSPDFTKAALAAAFQMQATERNLEQSIKRGFPLGEFWIQNDLAQVDDALNVAALNAKNEADLEALRRLESQSSKLRLWSDWLVAANRNLQLAEYYISPSTLDKDDRFQSTVVCTRFLVSMLAGRRLTENPSCH